MAAEAEISQDAITEEEIAGTAPSASPPPTRNAFTALMAPKPARTSAPPTSSWGNRKRAGPFFNPRDNLGAYIEHPERSNRVIFHNPSFVAIHDLYPKSSVHTLLLPTSPKYNLLHPFDALSHLEFLAQVRAEAARLKSIVAKELQRIYGPYSAQDSKREAILSGETELAEGEELPAGRDWEKEVRVGIHACPSMNHLHIHVLSVDRYSDYMKHRKHYNSFATPFFVPLEAFPLDENDVRRHPGREGYLGWDLKCWRCGQNFGRKFAQLKEHLKDEIEEWKRE